MAVKAYGTGGPSGGAQPILTCLSSDTKPLAPYASHVALILETDTNKFFKWDNGTWVELPVGAPGEQGPAGPQGEAGPAGADGAQGPQGIQGETGATGSTGAQGIQGVQGIQGATGPSGTSYTIAVQALTSSPADGQTVYFGMLPKAPTTTANISKAHIRKAGTIKIANIYCYSGTAGTNESWLLYIRLNNTTDTLIQTLAVNTNERIFTNSSLSIAVVAGDYIEIKSVHPTWATNPLTTIWAGYLYIE